MTGTGDASGASNFVSSFVICADSCVVSAEPDANSAASATSAALITESKSATPIGVHGGEFADANPS